MIWEHETKARLAKKCPFCGSNIIKTSKPEWIKENEIEVVSIECDHCGATVKAYTDGPDFKNGYAEALKLWNRRAN